MKKYLSLVLLFGCMGTANAQSATAPVDKEVLMQYFENQEYAKAADYLRSVAGENSTDLHALSLLGYAYYMSNQLSPAAHCYQQILKADPGNPAACNYLGKINLLKGDKTRALHFFCRLVDLKPGVAGYYKQLAVLWEQLGNAGAAAYYYRLSYFTSPRDPDVVAGLADHWITQEMYRRADSILDASLQQDSMQAEVVEARIRSAYSTKKYAVIFPLVNRLKRMNSIKLDPFLYAAIAYYTLHRYRECTGICDFMITHQLKTRTVLYLEALAFKAEKKYKLSLAMLDECIASAVSKEADRYFSAKGDIYETLHQYRTAIRQYDTAYYIFHDPLQLYNKGRIYDAKLGSPRTALHYYEGYLRHHRRPLPREEKPVLKFVNGRVKELREWEKRAKK